MKTCDNCTWPEECQTRRRCYIANAIGRNRLHPTAGSEVRAGDGYRLLEPGERLKVHDEGLHEDDGQWHEVGWAFLSCDYIPRFMVPLRRKIDPQNAEAIRPATKTTNEANQ